MGKINKVYKKFCSLCQISFQSYYVWSRFCHSPGCRVRQRARLSPRWRPFKKTECLWCGITVDLTVDHKNGVISNNNPYNLQTLCKFCHAVKDAPKIAPEKLDRIRLKLLKKFAKQVFN